MDDLGNLLYILFAVVAIVFNLWKKGKEAKPNTPPPIDENDPYDEAFPDFEQIFGKKEEVQPAPSAPQEASAQKTEAIKNAQDEWKQRLQQAEERLTRVSKKAPITQHTESTDKSSSGWFDARKAIIYSEILKRPEF